jgi:hypothetical protein
MKNSDEAIERVLAGLRDCEAPDGMERRILQRLEERRAEPVPLWRRLRPMWLVGPVRPAAILSVACGVVVASVLVVVLRTPALRRPVASKRDSKREMVAEKAAPRGASSMDSAAGSANRPSSTLAMKQAAPSSYQGRAGLSVRTNAHRAPSTRVDDADASEDSIAVREMHAASFPAPPMPLTEQEKLLLRIVHRGDPVEMAMLDPAVRAARDAEEKADVARFFERPTTKGNE